jgi:hypothetical protein
MIMANLTTYMSTVSRKRHDGIEPLTDLSFILIQQTPLSHTKKAVALAFADARYVLLMLKIYLSQELLHILAECA